MKLTIPLTISFYLIYAIEKFYALDLTEIGINSGLFIEANANSSSLFSSLGYQTSNILELVLAGIGLMGLYFISSKFDAEELTLIAAIALMGVEIPDVLNDYNLLKLYGVI